MPYPPSPSFSLKDLVILFRSVYLYLLGLIPYLDSINSVFSLVSQSFLRTRDDFIQSGFSTTKKHPKSIPELADMNTASKQKGRNI
jgi:hypothetical protein